MKIFEKVKLKSLLTKESTLSQGYTAFTLAEVLITLGIIGIVASLTIPTLIQKQQEIIAVTSLKKAHSEMSQAFTLAVQTNGTPDSWNITSTGDATSEENIFNALSPYLKVTKNCKNGKGCFPPNITYKPLHGSGGSITDDNTDNYKFQLADGSSWFIYSFSNSCNNQVGSTLALQSMCANITIDINGFNSPNQWGKDIFQFYLTKYGIIPVGTQQETNTDSLPFSTRCVASDADGLGCTAWVIYNENMDYLHCSDLAWDGKHKCS